MGDSETPNNTDMVMPENGDMQSDDTMQMVENNKGGETMNERNRGSENWGVEEIPKYIRAAELIEQADPGILTSSAFVNLRANELYLCTDLELANLLSANDPTDRPMHMRRMGRFTLKLIFDSKQTRDRLIINRIKMGSVLVELQLPRAEYRNSTRDLWLNIYNLPVSEDKYYVFEWLKHNGAVPMSDIRFIRLGNSGITNTGRTIRIRVPKDKPVPGFAVYSSKSIKVPILVELWYRGIVPHCRRCFQAGHLQRQCPQPMVNSQRVSTYSSVVVGDAISTNPSTVNMDDPSDMLVDVRSVSRGPEEITPTIINHSINSNCLSPEIISHAATSQTVFAEPTVNEVNPLQSCEMTDDTRSPLRVTAEGLHDVIIPPFSAANLSDPFPPLPTVSTQQDSSIPDTSVPDKSNSIANTSDLYCSFRNPYWHRHSELTTDYDAKYEKNTLFYSKDTDFPELSNFYICNFKVDNIHYICTEQYLFAKKAEMAGQPVYHKRIMRTNDPRAIKMAGRQIEWPADRSNWNIVALDLLWSGCWAKFSQNPHLLKKLKSTAGTMLAEASVDAFYGIGFMPSRAPEKSQWTGDNHFGRLLTYMRDRMMSNQGPYDESRRRNSDSISCIRRKKRMLDTTTPPHGKRRPDPSL